MTGASSEIGLGCAVALAEAGAEVTCVARRAAPLTEATFADPDRRRWLMEKIALGRVGEVEDVMGAVLYLACGASRLVTGTALMVDGGWTAA